MKGWRTKSILAFLAIVGIAWLGAHATTDFEAAEQRAIECCKPIGYDCSWHAITTDAKKVYEFFKKAGFIGSHGVSAEQKDMLKAMTNDWMKDWTLVRNLGIASTGCITHWKDHSECCRIANVPSSCIYLCDSRDEKRYHEEDDVDALVDRSAYLYGPLCWPHHNAIYKCRYAHASDLMAESPMKSHNDEL